MLFKQLEVSRKAVTLINKSRRYVFYIWKPYYIVGPKILTEDFIIVTRHPIPEELLARLFEIIPGFRAAWQSSLFIEKDGSFSVHGVFSEFSTYLLDHFTEFDEATWKGLFSYIEQCVTTDVHSEAGVANAARTCFLENIAGEGLLSHTVLPYLGSESRKYFDECGGIE